MPIFDTSAIINLSKRDPSDAVWPRLKRCIPTRGCHLSFVTVLELFNGLSKGGAERFDNSLKAVNLASRLSRRRVLMQSIPFMQRELFQIEDPGHERSKANLGRYLGMAGQPNFKKEFMAGRVTFLERIETLITMMRLGHTSYLEQFLDGNYPDWRSERQRSGSPLPESERERLKHTAPVDKWKRDLASRFTKDTTTLDAINIVSDRCDAYLTFSVSVLRDTLMTSYRFEENSNDFHDGMQLLYLSRPRNCLVTEDDRLIHRVKKSSQIARILTIDEFISKV
jgi:hypothetical protein